MPTYIEKQTELPEIPKHWVTLDGKPVNRLEHVPRQVVIRKADHEAGFYSPYHSHGWGQLLFIADGLIQVSARDIGYWVVPPQRAVWIPAFIEHDARTIHPVQMRNVYIAPEASRDLPDHCQVIHVTPLLRELILEMVSFDTLYDEDGTQGRIVQVFLDQLKTIPEAPLHLPHPKSKSLIEIAHRLRDNPADPRSIEEWATELGTSARSLARHFRQETGMTFGQWRQQVRLLAALTRIAQGDAVANVAQDLGYNSQSAFITMFRKALGKTPGRYFEL
ncbi:AraC family transcriptional regulator [Amphritea pacifica]|uniref:Helix-turn-helix transcriptional regulator n=1 Tax=Amphritea pacifica TaxID=2811233 RepID=A0ABS2W599_9GAMM|nr:helix-turn-helix transcriptional regulator [Amphritea pacifica]MBN0986760.1 helix-turn-helix transcriptional regulator [Amphritea pacifica]MBN1007141.1 helix-turn-helix transcriptional regulator [Amphritea pacifica]